MRDGRRHGILFRMSSAKLNFLIFQNYQFQQSEYNSRGVYFHHSLNAGP